MERRSKKGGEGNCDKGECSYVDSSSCVYGWLCVCGILLVNFIRVQRTGETRGRSEKYRG